MAGWVPPAGWNAKLSGREKLKAVASNLPDTLAMK